MTAHDILSKVIPPLVAVGFGLLPLIAILIFFKFLGAGRFKGWLGETMVARALSRLNPNLYHTFHDLYLPRPDGHGTTQIDHVIVSPFGIFVIETKNYRGWIFGSEKQPKWTQQIYRRKSSFQNPLHQNELHLRALAVCLGLPREAFLSVVLFIGHSEFRTPMPPNVLNKGLTSWILNHQQTRVSPTALQRAVTILRDIDHSTDRKATARDHKAQRRAISK